MNDLVAGEKGGVFPNSFPSLLPGLPALGTRSGTPPLLSSRAKPGGAPSTRDPDLFSPLAGETTVSESLPQQRGKKYRKKVDPDEGLMSRLSMSGSTPVHISDLEGVARLWGRPTLIVVVSTRFATCATDHGPRLLARTYDLSHAAEVLASPLRPWRPMLRRPPSSF